MDIITCINQALLFENVSPLVKAQVSDYLLSHTTYTKSEGNANHVNVFFLPYDKAQGRIYLGHHKKADDWIPPGGHIEKGETPVEAAIREMQEELKTTISEDDLTLWNLSYKYIGRPEMGCLGHYDLWYLVDSDSANDFDFDRGEYYDAKWYKIEDGLEMITKNADFVKVMSNLLI